MILDYHDSIEIDGEKYAIVNSHKAYFSALKICRNDNILESDKIRVILPKLFIDEIPLEYAVIAIKKYFLLFSDGKPQKGKTHFDLIQDAPYVYAGFMQAYGIDLDDCDLKVEKFIALLKGLPPDTKLSDIIKIRSMPIPAPTKYNAEQRASIIQAKATFALNPTSDNGMKGFGMFIKEWAKNGR